VSGKAWVSKGMGGSVARVAGECDAGAPTGIALDRIRFFDMMARLLQPMTITEASLIIDFL